MKLWKLKCSATFGDAWNQNLIISQNISVLAQNFHTKWLRGSLGVPQIRIKKKKKKNLTPEVKLDDFFGMKFHFISGCKKVV